MFDSFGVLHFILYKLFEHLICRYLIVDQFLLQFLFPCFLLILWSGLCFSWCFGFWEVPLVLIEFALMLCLVIVKLLLIWVRLLCFIDCEVVLLVGDLLPLGDVDHCVWVHLHFLLANLFQVFPLLLLLLWKHISLWWLVKYKLCDPIHKTRLSSLVADVYLPHLKALFLLRSLMITADLFVILCKNQVLLLRILYWSPIQTLCSFSDHHVDCSFPFLKDRVSIGGNLLL